MKSLDSSLECSIQFFKRLVIASTCHFKSPCIVPSLEQSTLISIFLSSAIISTFKIARLTTSFNDTSFFSIVTTFASNFDSFNNSPTNELILVISRLIFTINFSLVSLSISLSSKILSNIILIEVSGVFN